MHFSISLTFSLIPIFSHLLLKSQFLFFSQPHLFLKMNKTLSMSPSSNSRNKSSPATIWPVKVLPNKRYDMLVWKKWITFFDRWFSFFPTNVLHRQLSKTLRGDKVAREDLFRLTLFGILKSFIFYPTSFLSLYFLLFIYNKHLCKHRLFSNLYIMVNNQWKLYKYRCWNFSL